MQVTKGSGIAVAVLLYFVLDKAAAIGIAIVFAFAGLGADEDSIAVAYYGSTAVILFLLGGAVGLVERASLWVCVQIFAAAVVISSIATGLIDPEPAPLTDWILGCVLMLVLQVFPFAIGMWLTKRRRRKSVASIQVNGPVLAIEAAETDKNIEELKEWVGLKPADVAVYAAGAAIIAMYFTRNLVADTILTALAILLATIACVVGMRRDPHLSAGTNLVKKVSYPLTLVVVLVLICVNFFAWNG